MNEKTEQTGMLAVVERKGEIAISAMAAKAKAEVEARYVIALQRPRNINQARSTILDACKRPRFAEGARYRKPVGGGKTVDGLSIRFAEEAIKAMTNISTDSMIVWEDSDKRNIRVTVTDLESNTTYSDDILINKTVERRQLKDGQEAIEQRINSRGDKVYIVAATEDDMANKVNAAKSKVIRNSGLRLVPQDILEEAEDVILETLRKGGQDPKAETKKICDAFASIGVKPAELERLLGHSLESISPKELIDLRATFAAIRDEETTWHAVIATAGPKKPAQTGPVDSPAPSAGPMTGTGEQPALLPSEENVGEKIISLAKRDGVTEAQILAFAKKKRLTAESTEELPQMADSKLAQIVHTWDSVVGMIKQQKVE